MRRSLPFCLLPSHSLSLSIYLCTKMNSKKPVFLMVPEINEYTYAHIFATFLCLIDVLWVFIYIVCNEYLHILCYLYVCLLLLYSVANSKSNSLVQTVSMSNWRYHKSDTSNTKEKVPSSFSFISTNWKFQFVISYYRKGWGILFERFFKHR